MLIDWGERDREGDRQTDRHQNEREIRINCFPYGP